MTIDVTDEMRDRLQALLDHTSMPDEMRNGRDRLLLPWTKRLVVKRVQRIENVHLWRAYANKRDLMRRRSEDAPAVSVQSLTQVEWTRDWPLDAGVNEVFLMHHGTSVDAVERIVHDGFNERVGNLYGLFGAGVYFAERASKAEQYARTTDASGLYRMVVARVLLGRTQESGACSNARLSPLLIGGSGERADALIGRSNASSTSFREFVVYDGALAYPEFVVHFERNSP